MESNYIIAICTSEQNQQKIKDAISAILAVNENYPRSIVDYTALVIDNYVFTSTVESINSGKIKCDVYIGGCQSRLHLNNIEMNQGNRLVTLLLAGELDPLDFDAVLFSSALLRRISGELKLYSPLGVLYASLRCPMSNMPSHRYDFQVNSSYDVIVLKKTTTSKQLATAQDVIEEWTARNSKR